MKNVIANVENYMDKSDVMEVEVGKLELLIAQKTQKPI